MLPRSTDNAVCGISSQILKKNQLGIIWFNIKVLLEMFKEQTTRNVY